MSPQGVLRWPQPELAEVVLGVIVPGCLLCPFAGGYRPYSSGDGKELMVTLPPSSFKACRVH